MLNRVDDNLYIENNEIAARVGNRGKFPGGGASHRLSFVIHDMGDQSTARPRRFS